MAQPFAQLVGLTITAIKSATPGTPASLIGADDIRIETAEGRTFRMYHQQDCCESVSLNEVAGDLEDLIGSPILQAEEVSKEATGEECSDSGTWTFYKLATIKGAVTLRWLGESNGYYSEGVDFEETTGT